MRSSLSEWISQTKKISKSADYICMHAIDSIMWSLAYIDKRTIVNNEDFFTSICKKYHKPNPVDVVMRRKRAKSPCPVVSKLVKDSIERCKLLQKDVEFQWFEIIDFMFEKPHLVSINSFDEYIASKISEVCKHNKKINPLTHPIRKRFGKFYKNDNSRWEKERRRYS